MSTWSASRRRPSAVLAIVDAYKQQSGLSRRAGATVEAISERARVFIVCWKTGLRFSVTKPSRRLTVITLPRMRPLIKADFKKASAATELARRMTWKLDTLLRFALGIPVAFILSFRCKSVYAGGIYPQGAIAALSSRVFRRPCVIDTALEGPVGDAALVRSSLGERQLVKLMDRATILAQSTSIYDELLELGLPKDNLVSGVFGVDVDYLHPPSDMERDAARSALGVGSERVLLFLGRFQLSHKRLDLLLQAWRGIDSSSGRLMIAGEGPDREAIEEMTKGLPNVTLFGWQDDARDLFWAADVAVLPTNYEGGCNFLHESAAAGLPLVVSATKGISGFNRGGTMLVENELTDWENELRATLHLDPERLKMMGASARAWAETRRFDTAMNRLRTLLVI